MPGVLLAEAGIWIADTNLDVEHASIVFNELMEYDELNAIARR